MASSTDGESGARPADVIGRPSGQSRLLVAILIGIGLGTVVGGFAPGVASRVQILGDVFLNLLMMLVVPLVMLSMIVGITGLGDVRHLGAIGRRTIVYYMATTALAVSAGLVMVNVLRPGQGISPGEHHPEFTYTVEGPDRHTVRITNGSWARSGYNVKYVLVLGDQDVQGVIERIDADVVTVRLWQRRQLEDVYYVTADDGTRLPFERVAGELVSAEPVVDTVGQGLSIALPLAPELRRRREGSIGAALAEVLIGDEASGKQGLVPRNVFAAMANVDILPLIVFSLLLGAALSVLGSRGESTIRVVGVLHDAVMRLVHWVMWIAPVGIFALIAARIGRVGGFAGFVPELVALGMYTATVVVGLAVHGFVILPLILRLVARRRTLGYARGVGAALANAFSTSSSAATLPMTLQGVKEANGVSHRTASFVLPLGATINMDGTALYESVAAIFIAQVYGIPMSPAMQGVVFLTATLAAVGAAGIPEAGLVTMVIVLRAVGLPIEGIALILSIDWLLDRFRTTVNVWGDSVGAAVVDYFERRDQLVQRQLAKTESVPDVA